MSDAPTAERLITHLRRMDFARDSDRKHRRPSTSGRQRDQVEIKDLARFVKMRGQA